MAHDGGAYSDTKMLYYDMDSTRNSAGGSRSSFKSCFRNVFLSVLFIALAVIYIAGLLRTVQLSRSYAELEVRLDRLEAALSGSQLDPVGKVDAWNGQESDGVSGGMKERDDVEVLSDKDLKEEYNEVGEVMTNKENAIDEEGKEEMEEDDEWREFMDDVTEKENDEDEKIDRRLSNEVYEKKVEYSDRMFVPDAPEEKALDTPSVPPLFKARSRRSAESHGHKGGKGGKGGLAEGAQGGVKVADVPVKPDQEDGRQKRFKKDVTNLPVRGGGSRHPPPQQHGSYIHLTLGVRQPTDEEHDGLQSGRIQSIDLIHGRLVKEGYQPYADANGAIIYKGWEKQPGSGSPDFEYQHLTGRVEIKRRGLFFIYSQIFYRNAAARSGYFIAIDPSPPSRSDQGYAQCMTSVTTPASRGPSSTNDGSTHATGPAAGAANGTTHEEYKTCYIGVAAKLEPGQMVYIRDMYGRPIAIQPAGNYFGIFRIGSVARD